MDLSGVDAGAVSPEPRVEVEGAVEGAAEVEGLGSEAPGGPALDGDPPAAGLCVIGVARSDDEGSRISQAAVEAITTINTAASASSRGRRCSRRCGGAAVGT